MKAQWKMLVLVYSSEKLYDVFNAILFNGGNSDLFLKKPGKLLRETIKRNKKSNDRK